MTDHDWAEHSTTTLAIFLNGHGIPDRDEFGEPIVDDSFLLLINAHHQPITFTIADQSYGHSWQVVLDTTDPLLTRALRKARDTVPHGRLRVPARAMLALRHPAPTSPPQT